MRTQQLFEYYHSREPSPTRKMKRKSSTSSTHKQYKKPRTVTMSTDHMTRPDRYALLPTRVTHKPEFKVWDGFNTGTAISNTGSIFSCQGALLNGPLSEDNYIGNKILPQGLDFRFKVEGAADNLPAMVDDANVTRIILFQWMDASAPTVAGVLRTTVGLPVFASVLQTNQSNFSCLADILIDTWKCAVEITASNTTLVTSTSASGRRYVKGKKVAGIEFNTLTPFAWQKGGIYVLAISDSAAAPHPNLAWTLRGTFRDD